MGDRGGRGGRGRGGGGVKRARGGDGELGGPSGAPSGPKDEGVRSAFEAYGRSLDEHYDRRERLIKSSRDITADSKKAIFLLHREGATPAAEAALRQVAVQIVQRVATELRGDRYYRYARAFSPGIQEFVEAALFFEYLRSGRLATWEELGARLREVQEELIEARRRERETQAEGEAAGAPPAPVEDPPPFRLELSDYLLGVADLTGELMRRAVNAVGSGDQETPFAVCDFLRSVSEGLKSLTAAAWRDKWAMEKMEALAQSLAKVERTCYGIRVRGSEYPKEMLAALLEGGGGGGGGDDMEGD